MAKECNGLQEPVDNEISAQHGAQKTMTLGVTSLSL